jgi:hypothetical protein
VTRAKQRLFVTGAYWYGLPEPRSTAAEPSALFDIVDSHHGTIDGGHSDPAPRPAILRSPDRAPEPDPLFAAGWQAGLRMAMDDAGSIDRLASELGIEDPYRAAASTWDDRLFDLAELAPLQDEAGPASVSVTGLVTYAQCPLRYYWSDVDPLPRRRNLAAIVGTDVHRRIELHQRGQIPFQEVDPDLYDVIDSSESGVEAGGGFGAYEGSRFAERPATLIEAPFNLALPNGYRVRGRIDAIYADEAHWEIVDFKTGRPTDDPARIVQLQAYAVAASDLDLADSRPASIQVTFAYLGGGLEEVSVDADETWVETARARLLDITDAIEAERFQPNPGRWCSHCDFLRFCEAGQMEVGG